MARTKEQELYHHVIKPLIEAIDKTAMNMCGYSTTPAAIIQRNNYDRKHGNEYVAKKKTKTMAVNRKNKVDKEREQFITTLRDIMKEE